MAPWLRRPTHWPGLRTAYIVAALLMVAFERVLVEAGGSRSWSSKVSPSLSFCVASEAE